MDWHPTKGLLVSGSKDHQVKLWDPRNGNCLTTLHGHKSPISKVSFEPSKGQCLATSARDPVARIFDLRMMREVLLLRGHEHEITTLCWHPFHSELISTGSSDGSLYHYLLDEPNPPPGTALGLYPYDTPDPLNAPTQTVYPAHRIQYAHESHVWSLDWHPLGHILTSGSNDKVTRFWTRPRPGDEAALNDRYHLGQAAAATTAYGQTSNWQSHVDRAQDATQADDDGDEAEDEEDALVDQTMPARQLIAPGLESLASAPGGKQATENTVPQLPGMGNGPPPTVPPMSQMPNFNGDKTPSEQFPPVMAHAQDQRFFPGSLANGTGLPPEHMSMLFEQFKQNQMSQPAQGQTFGEQPNPIAGLYNSSQPILPHFPPTNQDFAQHMMPLKPEVNRQPISGFSQQSQQPLERTGSAGADAGGIRKRAPLPSQEDSLKQEQRRGKFRGLR